MCDGVAGKAPDLGLKSHVKARGLQGDDAASAARFRPTLAAFRLRCRPPVAIEAPERSQCIARARRSPPTALYVLSAPDIDRFQSSRAEGLATATVPDPSNWLI